MGGRFSRIFSKNSRALQQAQTKIPRQEQSITKVTEDAVTTGGNSAEKHNSGVFFDRLKDVYVQSSTESYKTTNPFGSERKQLQKTHSWDVEDKDKGGLPPGYVTVEQVAEMFQKRRENEDYNIDRIVTDYGLSKEDTSHLTTYFNNFQVIANLKVEAKI